MNMNEKDPADNARGTFLSPKNIHFVNSVVTNPCEYRSIAHK